MTAVLAALTTSTTSFRGVIPVLSNITGTTAMLRHISLQA
ncbi:hypothetical protein Cf24236_4417 [Citrobacter farmeri]|nr:hypothetical protein Cf24236_4417 [Citrobacter farmeri]